MPLLDGHAPAAVDEAARQLAAGALVAFPTETVYGLGARADDDRAVAAIFAAKGRPADHPLIVHVADAAGAGHFTPALPAVAERLIAAFWPGPLTVIVPRHPDRAAAAAGGHTTIGLRCPRHPVAQALLQAAAVHGVAGVAAPSANRFGRVSPTRAAHVQSEFGDELLVLDGGDCEVGIESTIVDCSRGRPYRLRPGSLTLAQLEAAAGEPVIEADPADAGAPRASGTLASHYAPRATLRLMPAGSLRTALEVLPLETLPRAGAPGLAVYSRSFDPPRRLPGRRMPDDAAVAAQELFAVLRAFDDEGVKLIWVEEPPTDPAWDGVRDRLQRAAVR